MLMLDDFIARLQKLHRERGNVPVLIDRHGRDVLEPAEPQVIQVVDNGTLIWREPRTDDSDSIIETAIEIL